ncbi:unnamed protein product [Caretta caretta]
MRRQAQLPWWFSVAKLAVPGAELLCDEGWCLEGLGPQIACRLISDRGKRNTGSDWIWNQLVQAEGAMPETDRKREEGCLAVAFVALRGSLATPAELLSQRRKRKNRTWDDMFNEILQASAASYLEQRAWRMNTAGCVEKKRPDRRKAQELEM